MNEQPQNITTPESEVVVPTPTVEFTGPVEILGRAWSVYKEHLKILLGIMLIPTFLALLFSFLFPSLLTSYAGLSIGGSILVSIGVLISAIVQITAGIALLYVVSSPVPITIKEAYQKALRLFFSYIWVLILVGVITLAGFLLLIIPGIIFSVWFSFAVFILIVEDKRGFEALKTSRMYVKGHWWGVFGRSAFFMLIAMGFIIAFGILTFVLALVPGLGETTSGIISALLPLFLTPLSVAYMYHLYKSVRSLKGAV